MSLIKMVCLANSRKLNGRCVAGIDIDSGQWIRPIGSGDQGALRREQYILPDGTDPRVKDIIALRVGRPVPEVHQPENWTLVNKPWRRVQLARPFPMAKFLKDGAYDDELIFHNDSDHVPWLELVRTPATRSLAVVFPDDLAFEVRPGPRGSKLRADFRWMGRQYDLGVTDPLLESQKQRLGFGTYAPSDLGFSEGVDLALTISLAEPFNGRCYKLAAAVYEVP